MYGTLALPRSLRTDPQWREFTDRERHVFEEVYHRAAFSILELDDHGKTIVIHPGQLMVTIRQLADWCNETKRRDMKEFDKSFIERTIGKFLRCHFLGQEVRHVKTILTITYNGFVKKSETGCETRMRQEWDIKEERQERKKDILDPPTPQKGGRAIARSGRSNKKNQKEEMEQENEPKLTFRTKKYPGAAFITLKKLNEALLKEMFTQEQINEAIETFKTQNPKIGSSDPTSYIKSIIENTLKESANGGKYGNKKNSVPRELSDFTESTTDWGYLRTQANRR